MPCECGRPADVCSNSGEDIDDCSCGDCEALCVDCMETA